MFYLPVSARSFDRSTNSPFYMKLVNILLPTETILTSDEIVYIPAINFYIHSPSLRAWLRISFRVCLWCYDLILTTLSSFD